jgi:hypothetical protein
MLVGCEVSTLIGLPAARLAVTQAAVTGSTARTAGFVEGRRPEPVEG